MKVDIEEISKTKRIFKIEVPPDVVSKEFAEAYTDLRKRAKIPGFRPGKAPLSLIERRYGKDVETDLLKRLIPDYYFKAVKESGVIPVEMPEIGNIDLKKDGPLTFTATVEIKPKIERVVYEGIDLKKGEVEATEKDVNDRIQQLREYHAQMEVGKEGDAVEEGDYVQASYLWYKDGKAVEGSEREEAPFEVGSGVVAPEIEKGIIGARKGEEREIEIPAQNLRIKIKIVELKKKALPELNDEFARDIGGYNSLAELRERVKENILEEKKEGQKAEYKKEIVKKLIEWNPVEAPLVLIEREMRRFLSRTKRFMGKKDDFEPEEEKKLREKYTPFAEEEIKGDLLLMALAEHEGITAAEDEVENEIKRIAQRNQQDVWTVRRSLESMDKGLEGLKTKITVDKVIKLIMEKAKWS